MALFSGSHYIVPQTISAKSAPLLHMAMKRRQRIDGMEYKYISIYYDSSKNEHIAWYYTELNQRQEDNEVINELIKK